MGLFSRKKAAGPQGDETIVYATTGGRLPDNQVPGTFQVAVVGRALLPASPPCPAGTPPWARGSCSVPFPSSWCRSR